jgi:hypothetical protein
MEIKEILTEHLENRVKPEEWSRVKYEYEHYESGIVSYIDIKLKINDSKTYTISKNVNYTGYKFPYINVGQIDCSLLIFTPNAEDNCFMKSITKFINMTTGEIRS